MHDQEELIEIYRIQNTMLDKIIDRKTNTNRFFLSIISGITVFFMFYSEKRLKGKIELSPDYIYLIIGIIGLTLCITWWMKSKMFKIISDAKLHTLYEMEKKLSFPFLINEKAFLDENYNHRLIDKNELLLPILMSTPFICLVIYAMYSILL